MSGDGNGFDDDPTLLDGTVLEVLDDTPATAPRCTYCGERAALGGSIRLTPEQAEGMGDLTCARAEDGSWWWCRRSRQLTWLLDRRRKPIGVL